MTSDEGVARPEPQVEVAESTPVSLVFPTRYLRFGEFQLDLQREELWKNGERVRLQGKVYQTLLILLNRAGDVVTREEVRRHLWPENPQVNFDANVNTSMNKLRQALGDTPESPTYIETIPRKGYCFLIKVDCCEAPLPVPPRPAAAPPQVAIELQQMKSGVSLVPHSLSIGLRIATLLLAGMIVGALLVLAWFSYARIHRALHSSPSRAAISALDATR